MTRFYVFGTLLALVMSVRSVQPVATLFVVDTSNDNNKGCGPFATQLDQIISDSSKLAAAGVNMMNAYGTDEAARRTVDAYFRGPDAGQRTTIINRFQAVQSFLDNNAGGPAVKPHLWCGSKWLKRYNLGDQAFDNNGDPVKDNNGDPVSINTFYATAVQAAQALYGNIYPYWSADLKQYVFDQSYGNANTGFCSPQSSLAAVQQQTNPNSITLCPRSFAVGTPNLGATNPDPDSRAALQLQNVAWKQGISDIACVALTIFHELFHLIIGNAQTPDVGGHYQYPEIFQITTAQAVDFPETYTLAAESYWYTQNKPVNGQRVDYATGKCLFADE